MTPPQRLDDLGTPYNGPRPARRVVSLVPSLTETLAGVDRAAVVGATDWCTHPDLPGITRVRGTKNPDLAAVRGLEPDLVVANMEENRELDVRRLRESGIRVWVTRTESVPAAIGSIERLLDALGWTHPAWLAGARRLWRGPARDATTRVAIAVWRDPWMVVGRDTFTGDLVRRLGGRNVFDGSRERYPHVDLGDLDRPGVDLVLLPDEPYPFTADDGPLSFSHTATRLISGRLITWYGPSLVEAAALRLTAP